MAKLITIEVKIKVLGKNAKNGQTNITETNLTPIGQRGALY